MKHDYARALALMLAAALGLACLPADARVIELGPKQGIADGVDEVIKAVRYQAKHGAEGINAAVRAGVASIDHGSILSDESVKLMKERGTYLVPNLYLKELTLPPDTPPATLAKSDYLKPRISESLQKAYRAGVNMALGTDAGVFPHGQNGREFAALVANGIPEAHALKMATVFAADLLGVDDRGVIEAGKRADLIAVAGDPLENISVMEDVRFVMKKGVVYKD